MSQLVDDSEDDVLEVARMPAWARFAIVVAAAAVAYALVAGALAAVGRHDRHPSVVASPSSQPSRSFMAVAPAGDAVDAADVAVTETGSDIRGWLLNGAVLKEVNGPEHNPPVRIPGLLSGGAAGTPRLLADPAAKLLWVVVEGGSSARMIAFRTPDLRMVRDIRWRVPVEAAAALDGHLYLSTELGAADLAPADALPRPILGLSGAVGPMAADAGRGRIVMLDLGYPTDIWTMRPGHAPVEAEPTVNVQDAQLAIAAGTIWVSGRTGTRTVVMQLDPVSLRPMRLPSSARRWSPGDVLVPGGEDAVWVRSDYAARGLLCLDATSGRVRQTWHLTGVSRVASAPNYALVVASDGLHQLLGCRG